MLPEAIETKSCSKRRLLHQHDIRLLRHSYGQSSSRRTRNLEQLPSALIPALPPLYRDKGFETPQLFFRRFASIQTHFLPTRNRRRANENPTISSTALELSPHGPETVGRSHSGSTRSQPPGYAFSPSTLFNSYILC